MASRPVSGSTGRWPTLAEAAGLALSRSRLAALITEWRGDLARTGLATNPSARVRAGPELSPGGARTRSTPCHRPQAIPLDIVLRGRRSAGRHEARRHGRAPCPRSTPTGTLVNALLHHCGNSLAGIGGERRPGHRPPDRQGHVGAPGRSPRPRRRWRGWPRSSRPTTSTGGISRWPGACRTGPSRGWPGSRVSSSRPRARSGSRRRSAAIPRTASAWRWSPPADARPSPTSAHWNAFGPGSETLCQPGRMPAGDRAHAPDPGPCRAHRPSAGRRPALWPGARPARRHPPRRRLHALTEQDSPGAARGRAWLSSPDHPANSCNFPQSLRRKCTNC